MTRANTPPSRPIAKTTRTCQSRSCMRWPHDPARAHDAIGRLQVELGQPDGGMRSVRTDLGKQMQRWLVMDW